MADPTISHGWVTSEPDAGKDVDADNLNDHQITGFSAAVTAIVTPAVAALSTVYQPLDSDLTAIAALTTTSYGRALLALADAAAARTALGLGTAAVAATGDFDASGAAATAQAAAIAAAATDATAKANAAIAASQPVDSDLTAIAALTTTSYGRAFLALADAAAGRTALGLGTLATQSGTFSGTSSGTNTGDQTLPTRTSLGLDTTDSPQFAGVNVGAATDTTITRTGAGDIAVEGNGIYRVGGTDVAVADGGTGSSTASAARTALGLAIGTDVAAQSVDAAQGTGSLRTITTSAAQAIGTAAAGNGTAAASSNHVHATGAGTPSTQAFGDAAATGTGPAAAMSDHKHGMPANPVGTALAVAKVRLSAGDITTISTSFTDVTGATVTLTTGAHRVLVVCTATGGNGSNGESVELDVAIDGTRVGETLGSILVSYPTAINNSNLSFSFVSDVLSAASHTIKLQWKVTAGTGTLRAATGTTPLVWAVAELPA